MANMPTAWVGFSMLIPQYVQLLKVQCRLSQTKSVKLAINVEKDVDHQVTQQMLHLDVNAKTSLQESGHFQQILLELLFWKENGWANSGHHLAC